MNAEITIKKTLTFENKQSFYENMDIYIKHKDGNDYIGLIVEIEDDYMRLIKICKNRVDIEGDMIVYYKDIIETGHVYCD